MAYRIILYTLAEIAVRVNTDDEDEALDAAHDAAREFANQWHAGSDWTVSLNDEWQLHDPTVERVDGSDQDSGQLRPVCMIPDCGCSGYAHP